MGMYRVLMLGEMCLIHLDSPSVNSSGIVMSSTSDVAPPATAASSMSLSTAVISTPMPLADATQSANRMATNIPSDTRRSARPVVPSKRAELLNKIGDNTKASLPTGLNKENIPPTEPPPWVVLAKAHLLSRDLGEDWNICIGEWLDLEAKLGYTETRVSLPSFDICCSIIH